MAAQLRVLRTRIRSVKSIRKITKAQELIASSRIGKARERVAASLPYSEGITHVLQSLARNGGVDHPLLTPAEKVESAGILVITSDRGMCGGYNANVLRTAEKVLRELRDRNVEPKVYVVGRKGISYFSFRNRGIESSWSGFSEAPKVEDAQAIVDELMSAFAGENRSLQELHVVYTHFASMVTQVPERAKMAPIDLDEIDGGNGGDEESSTGARAQYEFESDAETLLDALLPRYVTTRVYSALVDSAASELAARRAACKNATDNADDITRNLTREMNAARQAAITQEISEIVGGANALASAGSED